MKPRRSNQRNRAMTLTELLVVVVVLAVLVVVFLPAFITDNPRDPRYFRINCVNNLKQVGLAFRIWADDNNGKLPMEIPIANGGTMELAATGDVVSTFQIMSNELSTPKILFCPMDPNHDFAAIRWTNFTAKNVSYFIGLDANTNRSRELLSGDDNFAIGGVPVKSGLLEISTNAPITWTAARHKFAGNIGLADGSVQQANDQLLVQKMIESGLATNRLAIP
jgi:prepilin-type N-terminal cleavage/methylation domain-containing protein/prepilin-type processing-associated H-X9-DG protein